jgi:chromosomal replication initiation ATPase DnaA
MRPGVGKCGRAAQFDLARCRGLLYPSFLTSTSSGATDFAFQTCGGIFSLRGAVKLAEEYPRHARASHPQLTLKLAPEPSFERQNYFVSQANEQAFAMIELWPSWPDSMLILTGPRGAGKSHLGAIWASRANAATQFASSLAADGMNALTAKGPLLLEDADEMAGAEAQLFHLINILREARASLVLTARTPPDCWSLTTPDLISRLRLAPVAAIGPPDDDLMRAVLVKLLIERQLVVDTRVVSYIAMRLERSLDTARSFVEALDREALARQSRVTRAIAGDVLMSMQGCGSGD